MLIGYATPAGTEHFVSRFPAAAAAGFYRQAQGLQVSTLGLGTYLGPMDEKTDASYTRAIEEALSGGINFIDTSLNYRHQRSERAIGQALSGRARDEVVICTKAGYLVPDAIPTRSLRREDIVAGMHCLAPAFLSDQLDRSRRNLGIETVDVFYLHNPETQLGHVPEDVFYNRIREAFAGLEQLVASGAVRFYGTATWDGFRKGRAAGALSLSKLHSLAREVGGDGHHFRFIQLPVNLSMMEALSKPLKDGRTVLELAPELGITVVSSASLLQARLTRSLPDEVAAAIPGFGNHAQRAIQFARSCPGVTVALAGMSKFEHVQENLGVAVLPPIGPDEFARAFA